MLEEHAPNLAAVYSAAQVAAMDSYWINDLGMDGFELMQQAAQAAYQVLLQYQPQATKLHIYCGAGNNGGDGYILGQLALQDGRDVAVIDLSSKPLTGTAAMAQQLYQMAGGRSISMAAAAQQSPDVIADALLGTGLDREVSGNYAAAVAQINQQRRDSQKIASKKASSKKTWVLAVDAPSGVNASTGSIWGTAVQADATITFIGRKLGLYTSAGKAHSGDVIFADLAAPQAVYATQTPQAYLLTDAVRQEALPPRPANSHKGKNGRVLCLGGGQGMGGAVRMAGEAALRVGAGLVNVACHPDYAVSITQARPELMCQGITAAQDISQNLAKATVLALGPGLGTNAWAQAIFSQAMAFQQNSQQPLVMDADALNLLAQQAKTEQSWPSEPNWILTPHPGEAARLLNTTTQMVQSNRPKSARLLAQHYQSVVVLKGAGSLIATPDGRLWLCAAGNPGMATGGMGDVLTGIIAGLWAQGLSAVQAAQIGVWVHARAGDAVAAAQGQRGLLATDLLAELPRQVNP